MSYTWFTWPPSQLDNSILLQRITDLLPNLIPTIQAATLPFITKSTEKIYVLCFYNWLLKMCQWKCKWGQILKMLILMEKLWFVSEFEVCECASESAVIGHLYRWYSALIGHWYKPRLSHTNFDHQNKYWQLLKNDKMA